jgi:membrane-bound serine protease (ClpP class)
MASGMVPLMIQSSTGVTGSIPASRQADRVAVITLKGAIDSITAMSMKRRIKAAERGGFDAMVIEIDSPGGELGAVLEISNVIKSSTITNSVAWVRPDAYSGGAIIALACDEIVTSSPASMGDAFVILVEMFGLEGIQALSPDERTKFLPPLMADVTDSARRSGFDEYLVQAIVVDGIELWMAEEIGSGRRMAINEEEYRLLFGDDVVRGKPMLAEVTGGVKTYRVPGEENTDEDKEQDEGDDGAAEDGADDSTDEEADQEDGQVDESADSTNIAPDDITEPSPVVDDPNAYQPASPTLQDIEQELRQRGGDSTEQIAGLEYPSMRKVLTSEDRGKYRMAGYITDGSAAIVMRDDQLQYFGFSTRTVQNDEELIAFFGAKEVVRANISVTERAVRFMTNPFVRGLLIVIMLIAVFVEMIMSGTGIAGAVALGALVLILGPPMMIGMSGWWELIAIIIGVACLAIEAFVVPGFGVFGVIGFIALFGGLIGTFVSAGGSMSDPRMQQDLLTGAVTVLLAFVTAGIGWWLIVRNAQTLPLFEKLMLSGASGVGGMPAKSMLHAIVADDGSVRVGSVGVTTTPLYPIGQADIDGEVMDVYAGFGTIERGVRVRVSSVSSMRIEVEEVSEELGEHDRDEFEKNMDVNTDGDAI